jgi:hypothetical protein
VRTNLVYDSANYSALSSRAPKQQRAPQLPTLPRLSLKQNIDLAFPPLQLLWDKRSVRRVVRAQRSAAADGNAPVHLNHAPHHALIRSNHFEPYIQAELTPFYKKKTESWRYNSDRNRWVADG